MTIRKKQFYKLKYLKQEKVKLEEGIQQMQMRI